MDIVNFVYHEMIKFFAGDARRIQHFIKVHSFVKYIGLEEELPNDELLVLEVTALMHDIGIRTAEEKYGYNNGKLQEIEGPAEARKILEKIEVLSEDIVERVCYLIGHHHTYHDIKELDYQILVEADFLVNLYEEQSLEVAIRAANENIFRTKTGKELLEIMYLK